MNRHIEYWLDATSDHDDPRWIVSLEDGDVSTTLHVLSPQANEATAREVARAESMRRGLSMAKE